LDIYLDGMPDGEIDKITHENALRLYNFDMFSRIPKEQLTVGALRAQATDVDLGFRSSERLKKEGTDTVTMLDLASKIAT
ncbi:MAG TPA: amidohydrolase, partial [Mycobacterium sp.]|nr:amidohydrolase [Mycobacterium sp.]